MIHRALNRSIASLLFVLTGAVYLMTMAPTLSFWDCGEFIATARTLGVPHPPGAPLFLLVGRLFSMMPFVADIGARVNLLSVLSSAATVSLTYLVIVRFIILYRGSEPSAWELPASLAAYGGAVAGALALAFSDSFWFNAVETEVYAASSLFTALVVWIALRWHEEYPREGHERWLMLAMYMIGLSIGVHLLSLLALFAIALVYYFRRYELTPKSLLLLGLGSSALFFLIYILIIMGIPKLLEAASWGGLLALVGLLGWAAWHTQRHRMPSSNTLVMSVLLIIIGYTSYGLIYVRAQAAPPINENNPSTPEAFFSYLNREQYGQMPIWPRRWSPEPVHQYYYRQYSGDLDYFLSYQLDHMYLRYLGWQFIGRQDQMEGAGVDWSAFWGLPFLVGLFGAFSHFRRQWRMGLVVTALFILTGAALVVYLNQTQPQPRERDYSYVGSFFAFAIWIGIGVESLWQGGVSLLRNPSVKARLLVAAGTVGLALLFVDGRMLLANYHTHDRSGNYVPWDWGWNILESCPPNAILFTNGDNDTFPLWYLQEVEGIRTDVRVVNLSLANTGWYLLQLKNTSPRGAGPIGFSLTDAELREITYVPIEPVEVSIPSADAARELRREASAHAFSLPSAPLDSLRWELKPGLVYRGQGYLRPQDVAVYDIVTTNFARRPICFALTVDPDGMIGLERFLRLDGLVYRVVPLESSDSMSFSDPALLYRNLMQRYRYRNLGDPSVNIEETARRLSANYSPLFVRLALELGSSSGPPVPVLDQEGNEERVDRRELALRVLDRAAAMLPPERYPLNPELAGSVVALYVRLGEKARASAYISYLEKLGGMASPSSDPRLFFTLAQAYRAVGRTDEAYRVIDTLSDALGRPGLRREFEQMKE
ncbi:DUF2723 domain-containing protein [Chlorobium sp. N1]|uniref:glycosyltransferase family 117 protein n=1 Tax=Chlorobium sp. N1 TaxID=2491138 RepID=UPI001040070E|nr:DUF2723 domain-containing protein [Chlorobium sp. N1]TCD47803.1 DUF2723 domain-containing protein [Chlorobium sp. N1]